MRHRLAACLGLVLGLAAAPAAAQIDAPPVVVKTIVASADYDAVGATYCRLGNRVAGVGTVSTSGSSTTITANTTTAYAAILENAWLDIDRGPAVAPPRYVNAVAHTITDGDTLVVLDAVTIAASSWGYRNLACGTAAGDGWFDVSGFSSITVGVQMTNLEFDAGDAVVSLQCRQSSPWAVGHTLMPLAAALGTCPVDGGFSDAEDGNCSFTIEGNWSECRIGVAVADDEADDATTNRERISFTVAGR